MTVILLAGCLALLAGCSGRHKTYPVEGKVVWKDGNEARELVGGFVTLDSMELLVSAQGQIQEDGSFRLGTYKSSDGVPAGEYKVAVSRNPELDMGVDAPVAWVPLSRRYENVNTSGLTLTVEPKNNVVTVEVERSVKKR
jgi:hypothetical protein